MRLAPTRPPRDWSRPSRLDRAGRSTTVIMGWGGPLPGKGALAGRAVRHLDTTHREWTMQARGGTCRISAYAVLIF